MAKPKVCEECETPIHGRDDKRFCCDQCRSAWHNRQNSDATAFIRNINNTLRKNRRILAELNVSGKARVRKEDLLDRGFKFSYYTNIYVTKGGNTYFFCYDQGYLPLENGFYTLVVRQAYVE